MTSSLPRPSCDRPLAPSSQLCRPCGLITRAASWKLAASVSRTCGSSCSSCSVYSSRLMVMAPGGARPKCSLVFVVEIGRPAELPRALRGDVINSLVACTQLRRQLADQVPIRLPGLVHLPVQGIELRQFPAFAGLGFRQNAEHPGVANHAADIGHAAVNIGVNPNVGRGAVHDQKYVLMAASRVSRMSGSSVIGRTRVI